MRGGRMRGLVGLVGFVTAVDPAVWRVRPGACCGVGGVPVPCSLLPAPCTLHPRDKRIELARELDLTWTAGRPARAACTADGDDEGLA